MSTRRSSPGRWAGPARWAALGVVVALAAVALVLDGAVPPASGRPAPRAVAVAEASGGSLHCPAIAAEDDGVRLTLLAAEDGSASSSVEIVAGGEVIDETAVAGDAPTVRDLDTAQAGEGITLRWRGDPVVATYRTTGEEPPLTQACVSSVSPTWHLTGFDTTLGNDATLRLYNPFGVDAVAQVRFATPDGAVDLVTTQDLAVPAGATVAVDLDEVQPEVADLGVVVDVLTGRLAATGVMRFAPPDEDTPGLSGRTVVPAVASPADQQVFAYGASAPDAASTWLSVMNPDAEREALVLVSVSAPDAEAPVQEETAVPPGGTARIDLAGLSERRTFASVVTSVNDVDVVATRLSSRTLDGATAVDAGAALTPQDRWVALGGGAEDRQVHIDVFNPTAEPVRVTLAPVGAEQPDDWVGVEIEANGQRGFPLADLGDALPSVPVRVESDAPVAVGRRSAADNGAPEGFLTVGGVGQAAWEGIARRPQTSYDPALGRQPLPMSTDDDSAGGGS